MLKRSLHEAVHIFSGLLFLFLSSTGSIVAQTQTLPATAALQKTSVETVAGQSDPAIVQIMKEVSADHIQQTIEKLAGFSTRHTLSVNNPDAATSDKGIV